MEQQIFTALGVNFKKKYFENTGKNAENFNNSYMTIWLIRKKEKNYYRENRDSIKMLF